MSQGADDLYELFTSEIRPFYKDNVYASLGNCLKLDGYPYVAVSRALIARQMVDILTCSPIDEQKRRELLPKQIASAESALVEAYTSLEWPKYEISIGARVIDISAPQDVVSYAGVRTPAMFVVHNRTRMQMLLHVNSHELGVPNHNLKLLPNATRYMFVSLTASDPGDRTWRVRLSTSATARELAVTAHIEPTAIMEGVLAPDPKDFEPPMARVRVVDARGRYWPPTEEPSGVIRMITETETITRAERWSYVDRTFSVRVPLGIVRISLRRGLEHCSLDDEFEVTAAGVRRTFAITRWTDMDSHGWYSGDMHAHNLDPKTAWFESRAECLNFVNIMIYKHLDYIATQEHFTGGVEGVSDDRHFVYVNEEFRNEPMGHLSLINLKRVVQPIATGRLGLHWPTIETYEDLSMPLPFHGDATSPDYPLLLQAMRETHRQGGLAGYAHLRHSEWEFPLDAAEGELDFADIMTHTDLPQDLELWYALLNCGFRVPGCAGTDRQEPTGPLGHQRVYVFVDGELTYEKWLAQMKAGVSFVTNGPMIEFRVNGKRPGANLDLRGAAEVTISAEASSQLPFERLEVVVNGRVILTETAINAGSRANIRVKHLVERPSWISVRCVGLWHRELFYSNPVFAHTNPVYVSYRDQKLAEPDSARFLLGFLQKLQRWGEAEAYFANEAQRADVLRMISKGIRYYETLATASSGCPLQ